jgi:hypothetical protein
MPRLPLYERNARQEAWKICFQQTLTTHISTIPLRVSVIFASGDAATREEVAASERCCCHRCAESFVASGKLNTALVCACCGRSGCHHCVAEISPGRNQCSSRVCALVSELRAGSCNLQEFRDKSDITSRLFMKQWLVLQFKKERQLGALRAHYLAQSRYAALLSCQAAGFIESIEQVVVKE